MKQKTARVSSLNILLKAFTNWRTAAATLPHPDLAIRVLEESGYTAMWKADRSPNVPSRLENLRELIQAIGIFGNLPEFLEHVSLVMENDQDLGEDRVTLMTMYAAKGLEFNVVFLARLEGGGYFSTSAGLGRGWS